MTQHFWLMQRAITLQDDHFTAADFDQKLFGLYLRYQTTHERSYYKAMRELQNLRKVATKEQNGFASQKRQQELHEAKLRLANARAAAHETDNYFRSTVEAPLPGNTRVHFDEVKDLFNTFLRHAAMQHEKSAIAEAA